MSLAYTRMLGTLRQLAAESSNIIGGLHLAVELRLVHDHNLIGHVQQHDRLTLQRDRQGVNRQNSEGKYHPVTAPRRTVTSSDALCTILPVHRQGTRLTAARHNSGTQV
jgi:hypothetical protein